mmetsp:Transcript_111493/g.279210  ORF Transcript_111493/g.279210 Transcript_111493/m.279210 type:complete len:210 (-) Transcript_111493:138-767(-)
MRRVRQGGGTKQHTEHLVPDTPQDAGSAAGHRRHARAASAFPVLPPPQHHDSHEPGALGVQHGLHRLHLRTGRFFLRRPDLHRHDGALLGAVGPLWCGRGGLPRNFLVQRVPRIGFEFGGEQVSWRYGGHGDHPRIGAPFVRFELRGPLHTPGKALTAGVARGQPLGPKRLLAAFPADDRAEQPTQLGVTAGRCMVQQDLAPWQQDALR